MPDYLKIFAIVSIEGCIGGGGGQFDVFVYKTFQTVTTKKVFRI